MPSRGMAGAAAALITAASTATAETTPEFNLAVLPDQCRGVAQIPRSAQIVDPILAARISAVNCAAQDIFGSVQVSDSEASVHALDAASAPLFAALDDVVAHGSPKWKIQALYAKGDLLFGLQTRLRNSIPAMTADTSMDAARAIEQRHRALEALLEPWQTRARAAFAQLADIARANPPLASANPVLQYMVQEAVRIASSAQASEARVASAAIHAR
jgi:hypothetical protein